MFVRSRSECQTNYSSRKSQSHLHRRRQQQPSVLSPGRNPAAAAVVAMKSMSTKRANRIERKQKRMAALMQLARLNEHDRDKLQCTLPSTVDSTPNDIAAVKSDTCLTEDPPSAKRRRQSDDSNNKDLKTSNSSTTSGQQIQSLSEMKHEYKETRKKAKSQPKFWLRDVGTSASLATDLDTRVPLFVSDIQHLIMYALLGLHSTYKPTRWCQLDKQCSLENTNVLIVDNVSLYHFANYEKFAFPFLSSTFRFKFEIISPHSYNANTVQELAMVPLSNTQCKKYMRLYGTLKDAVEKCNEVFDIVTNIFPMDKEAKQATHDNSNDTDDEINRSELGPAGLPCNDRFPRTELLLSGWQMVEDNYPLPIQGLMHRKYKGYVLTKDKYSAVTANSPMYGVDCEMCMTTADKNELTRVSVVDERHKVIYDRLVKPYNNITNYLTKYSGITHKMLKGVTYRIEDVQRDLREILPSNAILVGQSLSMDLHALKMMHPYVIDTSIIFNITGDRTRRTKLKVLAREFLHMRIQESNAGHCPTEDSTASLKLVQLKLTKHPHYGDAVMSPKAAQTASLRSSHPDVGPANFATSMLKQVTKLGGKKAHVLAPTDVLAKYEYYTHKSIDKPKPNGTTVVVNHPITFTEVSNNVDDAVARLCQASDKYALNIAHVHLSDADVAGDNVVQVFGDLDTSIKRLCEGGCDPSLQIIVFTGGVSDYANGCCFVNVKWPSVGAVTPSAVCSL